MFKITKQSKAIALGAGMVLIVGLGIVGGTFRRLEAGSEARSDLIGSAAIQGEEPASPAPASSLKSPADLAGQLTGVFVELAHRVTPAVVQVEIRRPAGQSTGPMMDVPEPFREFFNLPEEGMEGEPRSGPEVMGGGTGFIVSPDGYVLTNAHVVDQADRILVRLMDRTNHQAELVGSDPTTDLAVIKIDATDLPTLSWGSSMDLRVGEPVMAVGNPGFSANQSLDYTVTTGIVSALGRPLSIIRESLASDPSLAGYAIENFIQTDAVINPGNSGGPLVDLWGRVVGVNSAIASTDGHYQGYGFAIPSDLARKVATDLMNEGKVLRGWLGVSVTGVTSEDAEAYRLPRVGGVLVQGVEDDGPSDKAGLHVEDVLMAVNGVPVQDSGDLQELVAERAPGDRVDLEVFRDGRGQILSVRLGEAPFSSRPEPPKANGRDDSETLLGMVVTDLTADLASRLGYSEPGGVVVTDVIPWSSAMRKGVGPGTKVREIDHTPIRSERGFRQALSDLRPGDVVTFQLETPDGTSRIVNLRAEG
jgi:serine protease Do